MGRARRGGPRTPSKTADANFDCAFVEKALVITPILSLKSQQNRIELVTTPVLLFNNLLERRDSKKIPL